MGSLGSGGPLLRPSGEGRNRSSAQGHSARWGPQSTAALRPACRAPVEGGKPGGAATPNLPQPPQRATSPNEKRPFPLGCGPTRPRARRSAWAQVYESAGPWLALGWGRPPPESRQTGSDGGGWGQCLRLCPKGRAGVVRPAESSLPGTPPTPVRPSGRVWGGAAPLLPPQPRAPARPPRPRPPRHARRGRGAGSASM